MVKVESSVPADRLTGLDVGGEVLRTVDLARRAHDREHVGGRERTGGRRLAGRRGVHQHGPIERDVERAGRAVGDQVAAGGVTRLGTDVLRTCGPDTISGSVFWLYGSLRIYSPRFCPPV